MIFDALCDATLAELCARLPTFKIAPQQITILNSSNISKAMLLPLQQQWPNANIALLPSPLTDSIDLLLVNLPLPSSPASLLPMMQEWQRILVPGGLLLFAALGGTIPPELAATELSELHRYFAGLELLTLGDTLAKANFIDLVLDRDIWSLQYPNNSSNISIEILFGHAIAPMQYGYGRDSDSGDVAIPIKELRRRLLR